MNNLIKYFYGIKVNKILYSDNYYYFFYNGYLYKLYVYNDTNNVNFMLDTNKKLLGHTLVSEIILNRNNEAISFHNNIQYILIKIYVNVNKRISLEEISFLANSSFMNNVNINWGVLWGRKIDYFENLVNENGKKYPLIVNSFNYFVGMAENAISYYNNILIPDDYKYVISHRVLLSDDTVEALYNPMNIIYDYRTRDIAEYIKNSFFSENLRVFDELYLYLVNNHLSLTDVKLLVSRLLYPSFYFEMCGDVLLSIKEEKKLIEIISKLDRYELFLDNVISFLKNFYEIDEILWLKKR